MKQRTWLVRRDPSLHFGDRVPGTSRFARNWAGVQGKTSLFGLLEKPAPLGWACLFFRNPRKGWFSFWFPCKTPPKRGTSSKNKMSHRSWEGQIPVVWATASWGAFNLFRASFLSCTTKLTPKVEGHALGLASAKSVASRFCEARSRPALRKVRTEGARWPKDLRGANMAPYERQLGMGQN